jgi:hypothetical protein
MSMNMQRIFFEMKQLSASKQTTRVVLCALAFVSCPSLFAAAPTPVSVYKTTDTNGRVTYSNAPTKGAVAVELAPLTVMPAHRAPAIASTNTSVGVAAAPASPVNVPAVTNSIVEPSPTATPTNTAPQPTFNESPAPLAVPVASTTAAVPRAATSVIPVSGGAAAMAKQRREEVRRRILEGEIEAEVQLQKEARDTLTAEQARSAAMRALRGSLPNEERPSETTIEARALIERHFARVRDLQDQVAMHEQNLVDLRTQLGQVGSQHVVATTPKQAAAATKGMPAQVAVVSTKPMPKAAAAQAKSTPKAAAKPVAPAPAADETPISATSLPIVKLRWRVFRPPLRRSTHPPPNVP